MPTGNTVLGNWRKTRGQLICGEENGMQKITINRIRCKNCDDLIENETVHDFKYCFCETVFVDGGHDYLRRGYMKRSDDYEELSEVEKEK